MSHIAAYLGVSALAGYAAAQVLGRRAGSTAHERAARMPGDELVPAPHMVTNHAVTISARPKQIWPWLTQMGWHLGGYYTPEWVDRLMFPNNWSSLDHLDPNLVRDLKVGDTLPDGPPGTAQYVVHEVDVPRLLLLKSTSHIPPGWYDKYNARITWTWCFTLTPVGDGKTRVHSRVRGRMAPRWFAAFYVGTIVPADFVMATGMLRGLKKRAETGAPPEISGRAAIAVDAST